MNNLIGRLCAAVSSLKKAFSDAAREAAAEARRRKKKPGETKPEGDKPAGDDKTFAGVSFDDLRGGIVDGIDDAREGPPRYSDVKLERDGDALEVTIKDYVSQMMDDEPPTDLKLRIKTKGDKFELEGRGGEEYDSLSQLMAYNV